MMTPIPKHIVWCYGIYQPKLFDQYSNVVKFHEGLPSSDDIIPPHSLLVIDDLMAEAGHSVMNIFTKDSHHRDISTFFLTQNLYYASKTNRNMSLNTHYMFLFKNPRDQTQIQVLSRQMYPHAPKYLEEAFRDATDSSRESSGGHRSYLFVDLKQDTPDYARLRTGIFPQDYPNHFIYIPNDQASRAVTV